MSVDMSVSRKYKAVKMRMSESYTIWTDTTNLPITIGFFYFSVTRILTHLYYKNSPHKARVGGLIPPVATNNFSKLQSLRNLLRKGIFLQLDDSIWLVHTRESAKMPREDKSLIIIN